MPSLFPTDSHGRVVLPPPHSSFQRVLEPHELLKPEIVNDRTFDFMTQYNAVNSVAVHGAPLRVPVRPTTPVRVSGHRPTMTADIYSPAIQPALGSPFRMNAPPASISNHTHHVSSSLPHKSRAERPSFTGIEVVPQVPMPLAHDGKFIRLGTKGLLLGSARSGHAYSNNLLPIKQRSICLVIQWPGYMRQFGPIYGKVESENGIFRELMVLETVEHMMKKLITRVKQESVNIETQYEKWALDGNTQLGDFIVSDLVVYDGIFYQPRIAMK